MAIHHSEMPSLSQHYYMLTCDTPGCKKYESVCSYYTPDPTAYEYVRRSKRIAGWTSLPEDPDVPPGTEITDRCPLCSIREDTLAGKPTHLNQSLANIQVVIEGWPHWFRQHAGFCPPLCAECQTERDGPPPVRLYDFEEDHSSST